MENIVEFPGREVIEDEALEWLIRLDGDCPLSAEEEKAFEAWLARSPAHREALRGLNTFWANCNVMGELVETPGVVALCKQRLAAYFWPLSGFRMATVATVLMALTLGVVFGGFGLGGITKSNGLYLTAVGQQKTITLADNSRLQLNTNSQLQVDYTEGFRNIRLLQGEVHFEVAKDTSKPFRVYAGSGRVQAVGTAFNVYLRDDDVDVLVTEGRVALASILPLASNAGVGGSLAEDPYAESEINGLGAFTAGEGVILKKSQTEALKPVIELVSTGLDDSKAQKARLAWRQGLLIFSGESLEEVAAEIRRYTPVKIEIVNPTQRKMEIGGQIQVGNTESMFKALEANFGLEVKRLSYNHVQFVVKD